MNHAYRGTGSVTSWNTEQGVFEGDRTSETALRNEIAEKPHGTMLVWKPEGVLQGCVWIEPTASSTWYLGSLAVDPHLQKGGMGRNLLRAAENWIALRGGTHVQMTVLNVRHALLAWYERRGYRPTGEVKPFPYGDDRFGKPLREDLAFLVLEKQIA